MGDVPDLGIGHKKRGPVRFLCRVRVLSSLHGDGFLLRPKPW